MKKKFIAFLLAFIFTINSFIIPIEASSSLERDLSTDDFPQAEINSNEKIRVIIEANSEKSKNSLKRYINRLHNANVRNDYDLVFNGFSAEITEKDYYKLQMDSRVKNISKAKVFYPTMASAKALGQIIEAQEKYSNNGEGMVISVIDSGLDLGHKDFQRLDNPDTAKIKEVFPYGNENTDTHFNLKVPYGYNFADNSYRVKGYASNHGIHVAGIAGANSENSELASFAGIDGVASQAQILAMCVFSNNPELKGAQEDDIIAAIEKSIEKQADIINMSLGSPSGFVDDNDPTAKAIAKAKAKGILVVAAAGNDTAAFSAKMTNGVENYFDRKDIGLVGSPSTSKEALSVASFENTHTFIKKFEYMDGENLVSLPYTLDNGINDGRAYKIEDAGLGKTEDFEGKDFNGKFAVIKRGDITFTEKAKNAKESGAVGAIIYNTEDIRTGYSIQGMGDFPVFNILNYQGLRLLEAFNRNKDLEIKFNLNATQDTNINIGKMSSFTSFGTTSSLDFKPEITGIGGRVYSTDNDNGYVMMDGTSMAAPYVAGASAIVYSQVKKDIENISNLAEFTKKTMMNTAKILKNLDLGEDIPYSVRRQGAGLVQVKDAIENRVIASFENESGEAAGALRSFSGVKTFNINLKNYSSKDLTFDVDVDKVYTTKTVSNNLIEEVSKAKISADKNEITVRANSSENILITIDANSVENDFVEGFIKFISKDSNQPSINFPYLGFAGNWNEENIIDNLDTSENTKGTTFVDTRLISMVKDPRNIFDQGKIFPLGLSLDNLYSNEKPSQNNWSISPNDDGFADVVIPQLGMLRNAEVLEFNILNSEFKQIRKLGKETNVRKQTLKDFKSRVQSNQLFKVYPNVNGLWDGKLYNPKTGNYEPAKDGQYYIEVAAKLNKNEEYQKTLFPLKIDTTAPNIEVIKTENDSNYELTENGRLLKFRVTDNVGVLGFYGRLGNKKINATKKDGIYEILIPFSVEMSESLKVVANDYALNEKNLIVKEIKGNTLSFTKWEKVVDKKINAFMGKDYSGITNNENTKYISIKFINQSTKEEIDSKDSPVKNGKFAFASYVLNANQQGKYFAYAIEKNENKEEIKRTALGEFIYDYIAPSIEFNYTDIVKGENVKNPLGNKSKNYKEYIMKKNSDGSVTFTGKVKDNVYSAKELKLTIGSRSNKVKINEDGSFKYILKTPSKHFDFINVSQPGELESDDSNLIDGLDLAVDPNKKSKKGLERTYVINSYLDSTEEMELPEFKVTTPVNVIINSNSIEKDSSIKVEKTDGEYYYTISGFTNRQNNRILLDGEEIFRKDSVDGGSYFEHKVKIQNGMNKFNLRVVDSDGVILKDLKLRITLDTELPNLILESPQTDGVEVVNKSDDTNNTTESTDNSEKNKEEYQLIKTWKNSVIFKGKISDNGLGYTLKINGDYIESSNSKSLFGNNEKDFEKEIAIEDEDIIILELSDSLGNSKSIKYKVKKVEAPKIVEVNDINQAKDENYSRIVIKTLEEKIYDVLKGQVNFNEILPKIEDTEDYKFEGWYLDSEFNTKLNAEIITEDATIYPRFSKIVKFIPLTPAKKKYSGYAKFTQKIRDKKGEYLGVDLPRNEYVKGQVLNKRVKIEYKGTIGYVYLSNLTKEPVKDFGYAKFAQWIRDEKGKKVAVLPHGSYVSGLAKGSKVQVEYAGHKGYVYSVNLSKSEIIVSGYAKFTQNIRDKNGKIVGILRVGNYVSGPVKNGKVDIYHKGKRGYVYSVNLQKQRTKFAGKAKFTQNIRNSQNKIVGILPKGVLVSGTVSNQKIKISYRGVKGFVWIVNLD